MLNKTMLDLFKEIIPATDIIHNPDNMAPYLREWRGRFAGEALGILRPETPQQVSKILMVSGKNNLKIIPQGGNTGLVGGQIPSDNQHHIILSLEKMNKIRDYQPDHYAITAESGVILQNLHDYIQKDSLIFPLHLASQGSAQIGGLISTNAGGTAVLQYGMMRDLVFGLEGVLPNGDIINDTHYLSKANRGLDLKSVLCGTEGAYGIVTAASLKLFTKPNATITSMAALPDLTSAIRLFGFLRKHFDHRLSLCELIPNIAFDMLKKHKNIHCPFANVPQWAVLYELSDAGDEQDLMTLLEDKISTILDDNIVCDVIIAQNQTQSHHFNNIRLLLSEIQKYEGASIKHDVSVPIDDIAEFITKGIAAARKILPDIRPVPFGHIGDGNIHFNFLQPENMDKIRFMTFEKSLNKAIFDLVHHYKGSFSAEHGIGMLRKKQLEAYAPKGMTQLQNTLKKALDPNNILNPERHFN